MNDQGYLSSGEKYDPETDTWSPIPDMSMTRSRLATAAIDDKIFVIGRSVHNGTNSVEWFNKKKKWFVYTGSF
jgi:hypothetical protein